MLSQTEEKLLTEVGPHTPLGDMMRRYWHPIALSEQVVADGPPLRTKLLGERFVVFRDTEGRPGVLEEFCMHRGVSLALGRNEEGGLRCLYHGWKFCVDGTIMETPNHAFEHFKDKMRAPAYPVREQSGLIWTYIGPTDLEPPFRNFAWDSVPESNRVVLRANIKANYMPLWEGGLDTSHVAILHGIAFQRGLLGAGPVDNRRKLENVGLQSAGWSQFAPSLDFANTDFGFQYCAFRELPESDKRNARLVPAIMPYMRIIPSKTSATYAIEVPMDDLETATYVVVFSETHEQKRADVEKALGYDSPLYDRETCNMNLEWDQRLGQDRSSMDRSWSGWSGIELEDFAMSVSQADWRRDKEHLVYADRAVIRMRRMILEAIKAVQAGGAPPGVGIADMTKVTAYDLDIAEDADWREFAPGNVDLVAQQ